MRVYLLVPLVLVVLFLQVHTALAYSSGAPDNPQVCNDFMPSGHAASPQDTPSPYEVIPDSEEYLPGSSIQVILRSIEGSSSFKGFVLQARLAFPQPSEENIKIGHFVADVGTKETCANNGGGTLTHSQATLTTNITVTWKAPDTLTGHLRFRATFLQDFATFWVDVPSVIVYDPSLERPTTVTEAEVTDIEASTTTGVTTPPPTLPPVSDIDLADCGGTKSCYRHPASCDSTQHCDYVFTWRETGSDAIAMELAAKLSSNQQYVAVGMSPSTAMGDTSVIDCIYDPQRATVIIQMSYNERRSNILLSDPELGLVPDTGEGSVQDGGMICRFVRYITVRPNATSEAGELSDVDKVFDLDGELSDVDKVFDLNEDLYIMMAKGPARDGFKSRHDTTPVVSPQKVNMTSRRRVDLGGRQSLPLVKAHAMMMVLAWMVCASVAVLMPRYMKTAWPGSTCCGKQIWFQIHQPLMILTMVLTIGGFTCIFIEAKGYSRMSGFKAAHPPLGIIVTTLVIINPFMSFFRCGPDHPQRKVFNVCHFLVGQGAHILAAVTMFLGVYTGKAGLPDWCVWVMVAFLVWHALCELVLALNAHCFTTPNDGVELISHKNNESSKLELTDINGYTHKSSEAFQDTLDKPEIDVRTPVIILHLLGILGLSITLCVQLGVA